MRFCNQLLLLGLYFQRVLSAKDAHYFTPGTSNPNVDHPLYWRDAVNILQDLDQFQYLYVSFNSCAWSLFGNGQQIMNCGGNGWEKSNWYMGHTACFRANAAFELYGVLKQSYGGSGNDDGCGQSTYINSFFTFMGVESFQQAIKLAGVDFQVDDYAGDDWLVDDAAFKRNLEQDADNQGDDRYTTPDNLYPVSSYCYQRTPDDDAYVNVVYNDDEQQEHGQKEYSYEKFSSYGLGCEGSRYARKTYTGPFCDGNSVVKVTDTLSSFNSQMDSMQCIKIYDANNYEQPNYDDEYLTKFRQNGNAEDRHEDEAQDNSYGIELYDSVDLLRFSRVCNVLEYPIWCSDPYGLSAKYRKALYSATKLGSHATGTRHRVARVGWLFLVIGILMALFSRLVGWRTKAKRRGLYKDDPLGANHALDRTISGVSSVTSSVSAASKRLLGNMRAFAEEKDETPVIVPDGVKTVVSSEEVAYAGDSPVRGGVKISVQSSPPRLGMQRSMETEMQTFEPQRSSRKEDTRDGKYKRPGLAKISRSMFGRSRKSSI